MKISSRLEPERVSDALADGLRNSGLGTRSVAGMSLWQWVVMAIIAVAYLTCLSPGHVFVNDDFAAYVMHAANLAEGRPYASINYIPNPQALWLAPSTGYPPVYPLILAPVYRVFGLNLRALKVVTVLCFVLFLAIFEALIRPMLSPAMCVCALSVLAFNPIFWNQREYILSEFPYLMFSFAALLVVQNTYKTLTSDKLRIGAAVALSILLYCSYGTRTIGIALLPALILADLAKFNRPSRFLISVLGMTFALILAQGIFIASPTGYLRAFHFSPLVVSQNTVYYAKTLSYVWQNGVNKKIQIIFALLFTALAGFSFAGNLWRERSVREFYLVGYLAILIAWNAEIGLRGLLPILPLYFVYGLEEFGRIIRPLSSRTRRTAIACLLIICGVTYSAEFRSESRRKSDANVLDSSARELFSFLQDHSQPSEVIIFPKPRTLALFTNRAVASFGPGESPEDSANFMRTIHATIFVKADWSPQSGPAFAVSNKTTLLQIFHNSDYQVFRVNWDTGVPHHDGASQRLLGSGNRETK